MRWRSIINKYNPPNEFVDTQLKGPYSFWHHYHAFESIPGGTRIIDRVDYMLPFGFVGRVIHALKVKRDLQQIFDFRDETLRKLFTPLERE